MAVHVIPPPVTDGKPALAEGGWVWNTAQVLLEGKKVLITGVLSKQSIAFRCAEMAQREGADVVLTSFGRIMSITEKTARKLSPVPDVLELDVNNPEHLAALTKELGRRWGHVDGALHAIAYAPEDALGGNFLRTPWESVAMTLQTSAFSLKELAVAMAPLMPEGGSLVTWLDGSMDLDRMAYTLDYLCDLLDRVPAFVWKDRTRWA